MGTVIDPIKWNYKHYIWANFTADARTIQLNNISFSFPQNKYFTNKFAIRDIQTFHHYANHARINQVSVIKYSQIFCINCVLSVCYRLLRAFLWKILTHCVLWTPAYNANTSNSIFYILAILPSVTTWEITRFLLHWTNLSLADATDSAVVNYPSNRCSWYCVQITLVFWHQLI